MFPFDDVIMKAVLSRIMFIERKVQINAYLCGCLPVCWPSSTVNCLQASSLLWRRTCVMTSDFTRNSTVRSTVFRLAKCKASNHLTVCFYESENAQKLENYLQKFEFHMHGIMIKIDENIPDLDTARTCIDFDKNINYVGHVALLGEIEIGLNCKCYKADLLRMERL